jgi:hypothetical protein
MTRRESCCAPPDFSPNPDRPRKKRRRRPLSGGGAMFPRSCMVCGRAAAHYYPGVWSETAREWWPACAAHRSGVARAAAWARARAGQPTKLGAAMRESYGYEDENGG